MTVLKIGKRKFGEERIIKIMWRKDGKNIFDEKYKFLNKGRFEFWEKVN